jgi:hypothetical protein
VAKLLKSPQRWGLDFVPRPRLAARRTLASGPSTQAGLIQISIAVTDIEVRGDSCGDICLRDRRLLFSKWRKQKSHWRRHPRRYLVLRNLRSPLRLSWRRVWRHKAKDCAQERHSRHHHDRPRSLVGPQGHRGLRQIAVRWHRTVQDPQIRLRGNSCSQVGNCDS